MYDNLKRYIDNIVWWIPFRKKRNFLRNELLKLINEQENQLINEKDKSIFSSIDKIIDLTNEITDINKQKIILGADLQYKIIPNYHICNDDMYFYNNLKYKKYILYCNYKLQHSFFIANYLILPELNYE